MAGSPTCGKMSTGMRFRAKAAQSATANSAATTVNGRERAVKTRRMLPARLRHERLNISGRGGDSQQASPDGEARQNVVDFRLREQPLGFGQLVYIRQSRIVSRGCLLHGG